MLSRAYRTSNELSMLYLPQVEQLGVELRHHRGALWGYEENESVRAHVWVKLLGTAGIITSHRMVVKQDMPFFEQSMPGLCIGALSSDSLALCPIAQPASPHIGLNAAVFGQTDRTNSCWLRAGTRHDAVSIMLLPSWFDRLDKKNREAGNALIEEPGLTFEDCHAHAIGALSHSISPLFGATEADDATLDARVTQAALSAIDWYEQRERAERAAGCHEQAGIVRAAKRLVELNLNRPISLDGLARELFVSRTRLCAAFKQETGTSLGAHIHLRKMERARNLLCVRTLSIADVARAVGYDRPPSFTVAFERTYGVSPQTWRMAQ